MRKRHGFSRFRGLANREPAEQGPRGAGGRFKWPVRKPDAWMRFAAGAGWEPAAAGVESLAVSSAAGGWSVEQAQGVAATTFGFLTSVDSPTHGVFGGYLLVDACGRPIEFHCTESVKISRAQQILYGPTLHGHLHGMRIGSTLLAEGSVEPTVVLVDREPMLEVRPHTSLPVVLVRRADTSDGGQGFVVGPARVIPHPSDAPRMDVIRERLEQLASAVELVEPFDRIRAAIDEAQRH